MDMKRYRELILCFYHNLVESGFQSEKNLLETTSFKGIFKKIFQRKVKTITGELKKMLSWGKELLSLCLTKKGKKDVDYMYLIPNLKRLLKLSEKVL